MSLAGTDIDKAVISFTRIEAIETDILDRKPVHPAQSHGSAEQALHENIELPE